MRKVLLLLTVIFCVLGLVVKAQNGPRLNFQTGTELQHNEGYKEKVFTRTYEINNTGDQVFNGELRFVDDYGTAFQVNSITVNVLMDNNNSMTVSRTIPAVVSTPVGDAETYVFDITGMETFDDRIEVIEVIEITGCLDGGAGNSVVTIEQSTDGVNYSPIINLVNANSPEITRAPQPSISIENLSDPLPACFGPGNVRHMTYEITVNGQAPIFDWNINISRFEALTENISADISSVHLTRISGSGQVLEETFANNAPVLGNIQSTDFRSRGDVSTNPFSCIDPYNTLYIASYSMDVLNPGEKLIIELDEVTCCGSPEFGLQRYSNTQMVLRGKNECSGPNDWIRRDYSGDRTARVEYSTGFASPPPIALNKFSDNVQQIPDVGNFEVTNFLNTSHGSSFDRMDIDENAGKFIIYLKLDLGLNYQGANIADKAGLLEYQDFKFSVGNADWIGTETFPVPAAELATLGYDVQGFTDIHKFEFEISEFIPGSSNILNPFNRSTLSALRIFMNEALLTFSLESECPAEEPLSRYELDFYIQPTPDVCGTCMIPVNQIQNTVFVLCPGCLTPGAAGRFSRLERITYGNADFDKNSRPDDPNNILTEAEVDVHNAGISSSEDEIKKNRGMVNDIVRHTSKGYITVGGNPCFESDGSITMVGGEEVRGPTSQDLIDNGIFLRYGYLQSNIEYGDVFDFESQDVTITISRAGTDYVFTAPVSSIAVKTPDVATDDADFFYDFSLPTLNSFATLISPTSETMTGFQSLFSDGYITGDEAQIELLYKISRNIEYPEGIQHIVVTENMFFSDMARTATNLGPFKEATCNNTNLWHPWSDNIGAFFQNMNYKCEGYFAGFSLVSLDTLLTTHVSNSRLNHPLYKCEKYFELRNEIDFGGDNIEDAFPNEFREVPTINEFFVKIPEGYKINGGRYYNETDLPKPGDFGDIKYDRAFQEIDLTQPQIAAAEVSAETYIFQPLYQQPSSSSVNRINPNQGLVVDPSPIGAEIPLYQWEEKAVQILILDLEPICNELNGEDRRFPNNGVFNPGNPHIDPANTPRVRYNELGSNNEIEVLLTDFDGSHNPNVRLESLLTVPDVDLDITPTDGINVDEREFRKTYSIRNTEIIALHATAAQYPFFYLDPGQHVVITDVLNQSGISMELVNPGSGEQLYKLKLDDELLPDESVSFEIVGRFECNSINPQPSQIEIVYGWHCGSYPTIQEITGGIVCNQESVIIPVTPADIEWQPQLTATANCNEATFNYELTANAGAIDDIIYTIDLAPGLTFDLSSIIVTYSGANNPTITPTNVQVNGQQVVITLPNLVNGSDGIIGTSDDELSFKGNDGGLPLLNLEFKALIDQCGQYQVGATTAAADGKTFCLSDLNTGQQQIAADPGSCSSLLQVSLSGGSDICGGACTDIDAVATGGSGNFTYAWTVNSNPETETSSQLEVCPTANPTNVEVTVTDNISGCQVTASTVIDLINTDFTIDGTCVNSPITFTAQHQDPNVPYNWTITGGMLNSAIQLTGNPATYTFSDAGNYMVELDIDGCTAVHMLSINRAPIPIIEVNGTNPSCEGETIELCIANPEVYDQTQPFEWYETSTGTPVYVGSGECIDVTTSGIYTVLGTDINGCSSTHKCASVEVVFLPQPQVNIDDQLICLNPGDLQEHVLDAGPGFESYIWINVGTGELVGTSQTYTVTENGTYEVTVSNGVCPPVSDQATITFENVPDAGFTYNGICDDVVTNFIANQQQGAHSWTIQGGPNNINVSLPGDPADISYTFYTPGTYTVTHEVTNDCGTDTETQTVEIFMPSAGWILPIGTNPFCENESLTLEVKGGPFVDFEWYKDGVLQSQYSGQNPIQVSESGNYSAIVTDQNGCITECLAVAVTKLDAPDVTLTASDNVLCNSSDMVTVTASGVWSTITWTLPDGSVISGVNTVQVSDVGTVSVTVTNTAGCQNSSSLAIIDGSFNASITLNTQTVGNFFNRRCRVTFLASPSNQSQYDYQWSGSVTVSTGGGGGGPVGGNANILGPYDYIPSPFVELYYTYNVLVTNETTGCQSTGTVDFEISRDNTPCGDITPFRVSFDPNPTSGEGKIRYELSEYKEVTVDIINILGARVRHMDLETTGSEEYVNLRDLPGGIYIMRTIGDGEVIDTQKIHIQK